MDSLNYADEYASIVLVQKNTEESDSEKPILEYVAQYFVDYLENTKTSKDIEAEKKEKNT